MEIRYSNGRIYNFNNRKEQKSAQMSDPNVYDYFLDMFKSLQKGEISFFKVQFKDEESNLYLNDDHSANVLTEDARELIDDKTIAYIKINCTQIIRDIKDLSSNEIKHEKK
jgi:hypothetical protein